MSKSNIRSFVPHLLAIAAATMAFGAQAAQVTGTVKDAASGALVTDNYDSGVWLCRVNDAEECVTTFVNSDFDHPGHYVINVPGDAAGKYRMRGFFPFDEKGHMYVKFAQAQSPVFEIAPGEGQVLQDLLIERLNPLFSDVQPCAVAQPGSDCSFSYTVTNPTAKPVSVSLWAEVQLTLPTPVQYTIGASEQDRRPITVELPANGSRRITQRFSVPADQPLGSVGLVSLQASKPGQPALATSALKDQFRFAVGASAAQARSQARPPRSGPANPIAGRIVDAVTGAPVTGPAIQSVNLYRCDDASFSVCSRLVANTNSVWVGADGSYSLAGTDMPTGRYQIQVDVGARTAYSSVVNYTGRKVNGNTVRVTPWLAQISNISGCPATVKLGAGCTVSADIENISDEAASFDVLANVRFSQKVSSFDSDRIDQGAGSQPVTVALAAGQKQRISISLDAARDLPLDGSGTVSLSASVHGQALTGAAKRTDAGQFKVVP